MADREAPTPRVETFVATSMEAPRSTSVGPGQVAAWTLAAGEDRTNQDAMALVDISETQGVVVVADGAGGLPSGERAAAEAIDAVVASILSVLEAGRSTQEGILAGFDAANDRVMALGVGAATTLVAAELVDGHLRPYHAGDSQALLCGQRGKLKLQTTSHSPVGYLLAAGVLDSEEAIHHEDLHVVSNLVGSASMHIEVGPAVALARFDTLVVGSDGLFDNLRSFEVVDLLRAGQLEKAARRAVAAARGRMNARDPEEPSKPDDLTLVAFRLGRRGAEMRRRSAPPERPETTAAPVTVPPSPSLWRPGQISPA